MESGSNLWVWLVGMVSRSQEELVGVIMGVVIRRWVRLECIGVVSGCGYQEVGKVRMYRCG